MMSPIAATVLVALSFASAAPAGAAAPRPGDIQLSHEVRPENVIRTFEGRCDGTTFLISLQPDAARLAARLRSLRAAGNEVSARAKTLILSRLTETTFIIDGVIHECGTPGSARARIRLTTVDRPWRGNQNRSLYFWLSRTGEVSDMIVN